MKDHIPKRGTLAYWPKKRAARIYPQLSIYPSADKARLLDFAGYKAAMGHAIVVDSRKGATTFGQEISIPATIVDCPPIKVVGLRLYASTAKGLMAAGGLWTKELPKDLSRKVAAKPNEQKISDLEKNLDGIVKVRLVIATQPRLSAFAKKTPEIFEAEVGGKDVKENFDFAKQMLGKEIKVGDIFKEGELVDVVAITKGKGMAGVVKRFGVKIQDRHAKKKRRHIGTLGPQTPRKVRWTVPQAGQLGFQRRTELNKRIIKIGEKGEEVTPKSGFNRYGVIKGNYIILQGSVPGPKKRLVRMRMPIRPQKVKLLLQEVREIVAG